MIHWITAWIKCDFMELFWHRFFFLWISKWNHTVAKWSRLIADIKYLLESILYYLYYIFMVGLLDGNLIPMRTRRAIGEHILPPRPFPSEKNGACIHPASTFYGFFLDRCYNLPQSFIKIWPVVFPLSFCQQINQQKTFSNVRGGDKNERKLEKDQEGDFYLAVLPYGLQFRVNW